ncbi:hypothetical protein O9929_16240 [Vibrio lentus]|nr:hypothetical protein [Vibrio lentus]
MYFPTVARCQGLRYPLTRFNASLETSIEACDVLAARADFHQVANTGNNLSPTIVTSGLKSRCLAIKVATTDYCILVWKHHRLNGGQYLKGNLQKWVTWAL